jgi:spermidine/putrescine transport system ATP-binding protein
VTVPSERLRPGARAVKLGVRPEKIRLEPAEGDPRPDWNCVSGTVQMAAFVGVSHQYTVEGPGGRTLTVYAQNLESEATPRPGDPVRLVWKPQHTFVVRPSDAGAAEEET